jgi:hypothetical protein
MTAPQPGMRLLGSASVGGTLAVDDVGGLVDHLRPLASRAEPLLLITAVGDAATAARTLSLARAGAPGANAVVHASALPPLARRGLIEVLGSLRGSSAGQLLVVAEAIERTMLAGAVVSSVARLADPGPSMGQHLRSWWPRTTFVVTTHPHPAITSVARGDAGQVPLPWAAAPMYFARAGDDPITGAVADQLAQRLTGGPAGPVDLPPESARRWGAGRFTEFSALPRDLGLLVRTALDAAEECRSCGAPVVWASCRFCRAVRRLEPTPEPAALSTAAASNREGAP